MSEEIKQQQDLNIENKNNQLPELNLMFTVKPGMDPRRYNIQSSN